MKSSLPVLIFTIILGGISLIGFLGHILFRIMHWPGSGFFRLIGLGCAVAGFGLFFLYRSMVKKENAMPAATPAAPTPKAEKPSPQPQNSAEPAINGPIAEDIWEDDEE